VTYFCDDGFYMSGSRERVCQGDGSWSDQPPACKKQGNVSFLISFSAASKLDHTASQRGDFLR
jgi:hypothetical protein